MEFSIKSGAPQSARNGCLVNRYARFDVLQRDVFGDVDALGSPDFDASLAEPRTPASYAACIERALEREYARGRDPGAGGYAELVELLAAL